MNLTGRRI